MHGTFGLVSSCDLFDEDSQEWFEAPTPCTVRIV